MYAVYPRKVNRWNDVLGETPLFEIDAETRKVWLSQNAIASIGGGTAVRLLLNLPPTVQPSVAMGEGILVGVADGKPYAIECAAAYSRHWRPYCNYPRMAA